MTQSTQPTGSARAGGTAPSSVLFPVLVSAAMVFAIELATSPDLLGALLGWTLFR